MGKSIHDLMLQLLMERASSADTIKIIVDVIALAAIFNVRVENAASRDAFFDAGECYGDLTDTLSAKLAGAKSGDPFVEELAGAAVVLHRCIDLLGDAKNQGH